MGVAAGEQECEVPGRKVMACVAIISKTQGHYTKALEWYKTALAGSETLGNEHLFTIATISNIGSVLLCQGNYNEAMEWCMRSFSASKKVLGKDHPSTLRLAHIDASFICAFNIQDLSQAKFRKV